MLNACCFSLKRLKNSLSCTLLLTGPHSVTNEYLTARAVEECDGQQSLKYVVTRHRETISSPPSDSVSANYERTLKKIRESSLELAIWKSFLKTPALVFILAHLATGRIQIVHPNLDDCMMLIQWFGKLKKKVCSVVSPLSTGDVSKTPSGCLKFGNSTQNSIYNVFFPYTHTCDRV